MGLQSVERRAVYLWKLIPVAWLVFGCGVLWVVAMVMKRLRSRSSVDSSCDVGLQQETRLCTGIDHTFAGW